MLLIPKLIILIAFVLSVQSIPVKEVLQESISSTFSGHGLHTSSNVKSTKSRPNKASLPTTTTLDHRKAANESTKSRRAKSKELKLHRDSSHPSFARRLSLIELKGSNELSEWNHYRDQLEEGKLHMYQIPRKYQSYKGAYKFESYKKRKGRAKAKEVTSDGGNRTSIQDEDDPLNEGDYKQQEHQPAVKLSSSDDEQDWKMFRDSLDHHDSDSDGDV